MGTEGHWFKKALGDSESPGAHRSSPPESDDDGYPIEGFNAGITVTPPVPEHIRSSLSDLYSRDGVLMWWTHRNRLLGGRPPCEVYRTDPAQVRAAVDYLTGLSW